MACIEIKHYPKVKDLIHLSITDNTYYYRKRNLYILLVYHGCCLRKRNGLKKEQIIVEINSLFCHQANLIGEEQEKNTNYRE